MWIRMTQPFATLDAGRIFDVSSALAMYLRAMHCAEPAEDNTTLIATKGPRTTAPITALKSRFVRNGSIAEARIRIAGRWHRLQVELDDALMRACSFYLDRGPEMPRRVGVVG